MNASRGERVRLYKHVAQVLRESGEVAGEGFILRLAEIAVDATLEALPEAGRACP